MTTKRVLLGCTVISVQDSCFMYPCCRFCLSRLIDECDLRSRCPKCSFRYDIQNVDYRYRLSLKVLRDKNTFGVTVFGGCLNSFFGITAGDLQRFIYSGRQEGPQRLQHLLMKAVEDCFIGKHFVFGFKISGLDSLLSHEHTSLGFSSESSQLVACQIISPNVAFLGITVFAYLQRLLQAGCLPCSSVSTKPVCQSQQKDSLLSFEHTLPLCSEASSLGLTPSRLWQPTSDLVLCFSPEETSEHSLQQLTIDEVHSKVSCLSSSLDQVKSDGVQYAELCTSKTYESKSVIHYHCNASNDLLSNVSSIADQSDSSAPPTSSVVCDSGNPTSIATSGLETESPPCIQWTSEKLSGRECNASFLEKTLFSHSVQHGSIDLIFDAPLSETLRGFINIKPQIPKEFNINSLERDQITPQKTNCSILEDHMVSCSSDTRALCSYQSVLTPLHNITNVSRENGNGKLLKRKYTKRKILSAYKHCLPKTKNVSLVPKGYSGLLCGVKDINSKINDLTKNSVRKMCGLPNDKNFHHFEYVTQMEHAVCPEMQTQGVKEQENAFGGHGDEYNCSADLFHQISMDINIPDITEISVCDQEMKKDGLLDSNVSGPEVLRSFHFEPSLQSTPKAYPYDQYTCGKSCKRSKKFSDLQCSKKHLTTSVRVIRNHQDIRQRPKAGKLEFSQIQSSDFMIKNDPTSDGGSEVEGNTERELEKSDVHTNINEWSRDLFAH